MDLEEIKYLKSKEQVEQFVFFEDVTPLNFVKLQTPEKALERPFRIKNVWCNFPTGEEGDLHVQIYAVDATGVPIEVIRYMGGKKYLYGDDVTMDLKVDVPCKAYSGIVVVGTNVESTGAYTYPLEVIVAVEYER